MHPTNPYATDPQQAAADAETLTAVRERLGMLRSAARGLRDSLRAMPAGPAAGALRELAASLNDIDGQLQDAADDALTPTERQIEDAIGAAAEADDLAWQRELAADHHARLGVG